MLTRSQKDKILEGVKIRLPEFKEFEESRNKLIEKIREFSISILTPREKEFIKKKPDFVEKQPDLKFLKGYFNVPDDPELNEIIPREYGYWISYKSRVTYDFILRLRLGFNESKTDMYPIIGEEWRDIEKTYPEFYKTIYPLIRSVIVNNRSVVVKLEKLEEVLELKSLGLTDLKKYYVELYKICKE